jgi:hypothetical protein
MRRRHPPPQASASQSTSSKGHLAASADIVAVPRGVKARATAALHYEHTPIRQLAIVHCWRRKELRAWLLKLSSRAM